MNFENKSGQTADFQVSYKFFSEKDGGRKNPPFQGYRCDWLYDGDDPKVTGVYMIHPEFLDEKGQSIEDKKYVPVEGVANMRIVFSEMRDYHQKKIKVGLRGYFVEGARKVAEAKVIRVLGLHSNKS